MSDATTYALLATAATTALLHTLIPDHWLPFVLIGRARGWSVSQVALVSGLSGMIHAALSVLLGLATLWIGLTAMEAVGETLEWIGGLLLIVFGLGYAGWSWSKGGHFHPGGSLVHGRAAGEGCSGREGPEHPEHLHYHADEGLIASRGGWGAVGLAVIVGVNPCVLVLPILLASAPRGAATIGLVATAYAVPTVLLMVGLSVIGVGLGWRIRLPWAARYAEPGSGLLIALLGLLFLVVGR